MASSNWKCPRVYLPREVEVVLVMQDAEPQAVDANGWPTGFFNRTYGALADDPIERPPQLPLEEREHIE